MRLFPNPRCPHSHRSSRSSRKPPMEVLLAKPRLRLLLDHLSKMKDTRQVWKVAYPLREILFLVLPNRLGHRESVRRTDHQYLSPRQAQKRVNLNSAPCHKYPI
jgi:hypothetical protein